MQSLPRRLALAIALSAAIGAAHADTTPQTLPFAQDWTDTGQITANDNWSGVPGIVGYLGAGLASGNGVDPQTVLGADAAGVVDVIANQASTSISNGGVAEFHIANPVVALQGSGSANAPYIRIHLDTRGSSGIQVSYRLRDVDTSADDAVQQVALHYRVGGTGDFSNVPAAYVADASSPGTTRDTPVSVTLPATVDNQALVELRIMTTNATGNDEWIGIDDIQVTANGGGGSGPVLDVADGSATEGDSGTTGLVFPIRLSQPAPAGGVSFDYTTYDDTFDNPATAGQDYIARSGSVTIAEGGTSADLSISILGDTLEEPDETFGLLLSNVTGARGGNLRGIGTILTDDFRLTPIPAIQGSGARSPLEGQGVTTTGIVTARKNNGFFMQMPDDPKSLGSSGSTGIFVFTSAPPGPEAAVGNLVRVQGEVTEYVPAADPHQLPMTELTFATITALSTGHPLPAPVLISADSAHPDGGLDQLERYEGRRVRVPDALVVAPTRGNTNEAQATSTGNGQFAVVAAGVARPLREPGIQVPDPDPSGTSATAIPRWDFNPEVIAVDSDTIGAPQANVAAGCRIVADSLTGPLDYTFRRYTVYPEGELAVECDGLDQPRGSVLPSEDHATFATYNLHRFFDTVNDPAISEPVLSAQAFDARLAKASLGIRAYMHAPDIIGVSEVENLAALQALATRINADAVSTGGADPGYVAYLVEGNDVGGIDVGFLVKAGEIGAALPRVDVLSVEQVGKDATWTYAGTGATSLLNDRPPLVLDAVVNFADGRALPVTVVTVHQRSLNDVDSEEAAGSGTLGDRVRQKRQRQAEFLAGMLQDMQGADPDRNIVVLGDFNAFEFNDGLADVMGTVIGMPSADPTTAVDGDGVDLVEPDLVNATYLLAPEERYSFVFENNAQSLDHILVNQATLGSPLLNSWTISHARLNADFPETARNDATSAARLSDHDPSVLMLRLNALRFADLATGVAAVRANVPAGERLEWTVTVDNQGPDAAGFPGMGLVVDIELGDFAVVAPAGWTCEAPVAGGGETGIACTADALETGAQAAFEASATAPLAAAGSVVALTAAASSQTEDPAPANDVGSAAISVAAVADLGVAVIGPLTYVLGTRVEHEAVVANSGPSAAVAPEVVLSATMLSASRVSVSAPDGWTCQAAPTSHFRAVCHADDGVLASGSAARFGITAATGGGNKLVAPRYELSVDARSESFDPVSFNNSEQYPVVRVRAP